MKLCWNEIQHTFCSAEVALAEEGGNDEENQGSGGDAVQDDAWHQPFFDHSKIKGAL